MYLYGEAATEDHRKTVPQIRAGEYEGLPEKVKMDSNRHFDFISQFAPQFVELEIREVGTGQT